MVSWVTRSEHSKSSNSEQEIVPVDNPLSRTSGKKSLQN